MTRVADVLGQIYMPQSRPQESSRHQKPLSPVPPRGTVQYLEVTDHVVRCFTCCCVCLISSR